MKDYWELIKNTGESFKYELCQQLESECKKLLALKQDDNYKIEYYVDGDLRETVLMSDYFNVDNYSS